MRRQKVVDSPEGFTLIELLVVITIIGILVALLLPAVQAAREAARATQCRSHLKQQALAMHSHHDTYRYFPSGGWGYNWVGDSDRGGLKQPGGWMYSVLPFIEQVALYDLGADGDPNVITPQQRNGTQQMIGTPLPIFTCPTRRSATGRGNPSGWGPRNGLPNISLARSDYAANAGDFLLPGVFPGGPPGGPLTLADGDSPAFPWTDVSQYTGICYRHTVLRMADVLDGTSNTFMLGEKSLNPEHYTTGGDFGDNESLYVGADIDVNRWTWRGSTPLKDKSGITATSRFGSAHPGGVHFANCDGSVRAIAYTIDNGMYWRLGNRMDGDPVRF
jgi:prepilin-type N-terminal cleavage/methylation domain-containing protein